MQPHEWARILSDYREPILSRSVFELAVTLTPLVSLWALAWWMTSVSAWLALSISVVNAAFLVRAFMIQHDCGHGSFLRNRPTCNWIGRALGVLTLTPYDVWRQTHAIHHATNGNLDRRGIGDVPVLTVKEYRDRSTTSRFLYRLIRNPLFLFGIVPFYTFFLQNRVPIGLARSGWRYWVSSLGTNLAILAICSIIVWAGGWKVLMLVYLPTMLVAASVGMWLFYVQHQFADTIWEREENWNVQQAALQGSSYYALPAVLRWITGNIGVHHVHHLASRIPFYRLNDVLRDHEELANCKRLTLWSSFHCARLHLWDERGKQLVTFAKARSLPA